MADSADSKSTKSSGKKLDLPPVFGDDEPSPPPATERFIQRDQNGNVISDTGERPVYPQPITQEEFDKARGGLVRQKSWERALAKDQRRRPANSPASPKRKPNW